MALSKRQLFALLGAGAASALLTSVGAHADTSQQAITSLSVANTSAGEATAAQINVFQAVVLGIVQGLTEFLPISSTAHLKVVPVVLGWGDPGVAFTAVIQLGSIAAVLWYFWGDLTKITTGAIRAIARSDY